ncbi:hypothetical protein M911_07810 [Ectothiorhodospira haloalkaliphila]|uniref:Uncharacterized protein n=1 Tax=Ectothiorhodospira haloalkaliphila TaxID=421628 RepID=W8KLM5_9GAMM|nr:hypothetical protein [Ectothiorhodospira haloalkaliphila]AHK80669.1 hypothetical protein M911_07810 [Ectothiorhodospira haloalkaliphila]
MNQDAVYQGGRSMTKQEAEYVLTGGRSDYLPWAVVEQAKQTLGVDGPMDEQESVEAILARTRAQVRALETQGMG